MSAVGIVAALVLLGLIPGVIAQRKGRGFWTYWLFGAMLFVVALPAALLLKPRRRLPG